MAESPSVGGGFMYTAVIALIRAYKAFEAVIIKLFLGFFEKLVKNSYKNAGIEIDGKNPWDIKVHRKSEFVLRLTNNAPLGLGESYVDGVWDCDDMVELNYRTMRKGIYTAYMNPWNRFLNYLEFVHFNLQTEKKAWEVGEKHYNLGEKPLLLLIVRKKVTKTERRVVNGPKNEGLFVGLNQTLGGTLVSREDRAPQPPAEPRRLAETIQCWLPGRPFLPPRSYARFACEPRP